MRPDDLIATARELALSGRRRPRQSNLRRAVSTAYYALFHCLAACCADTLVGGESANRSDKAWRQAYRAVEHGRAKQRCEQTASRAFPGEVIEFATHFADLQRDRHHADYDPVGNLTKSDVLQSIESAADVVRQFGRAPAKHRRAFAIFVLLPSRRN